MLADQGHAEFVARVNPPIPPVCEKLIDVGVSVAVHPDSCVTVSVLSPIDTVPVRSMLVFAETCKPTLALPEPDAPLTTEIHGELLTASHVQPVAVLRETFVEIPAGVTDIEFEDNEYEQFES